MDYKELIALSQKAADEWRNDHSFYQAGTLIDSLCSAIETLTAERDAAVEELHGECSKCRFSDFGAFDFPCFRCSSNGGMTDYWQWRGPQKEGVA